MDTKFLQRVLSTVETHLESRPSPSEFELAYQARTACDRIRFAIKNTEVCIAHSPQVREANLQLLDALDRLESAERHFQAGFRPKSLLSEAEQPRCNNGNGANRSKHAEGG